VGPEFILFEKAVVQLDEIATRQLLEEERLLHGGLLLLVGQLLAHIHLLEGQHLGHLARFGLLRVAELDQLDHSEAARPQFFNLCEV
jgi:hypothetical protein